MGRGEGTAELGELAGRVKFDWILIFLFRHIRLWEKKKKKKKQTN